MKTQKMSITTILATFAFMFVAFCGSLVAQDNPFAPEKAPPLPEGMKGSNISDPRFSLSAGAYDAAEFSFGMKHVNLYRKPSAFDLGVDPNDPRVGKALFAMGIPENAPIPPAMKMPIAGLALANSDLAFQGNYLFLGNFYGINIYNIADPAKAQLVTSMLCPGGQGDVSVYKNLMFMSVEMQNGRIDCGTQAFPAQTTPGLPAAQKDRFRGVRIFDISDIKNPKQVAAVQSCRGSHTHTLVEDPKDPKNVYVYISGTSFVRQSEELAGCTDGDPNTTKDTARFRIDIIKVPVAAPQEAKIIASPRIFGEGEKINALNDGGSHANKGRPEETDQCHDITVYSEIGLAAGACSGNGILLDIKDPANPKRIEAVNDKNYAYWHSASFSNDGKKVVFTDEWGGGMGARCRATDPTVWGANAIFNLEGGKLKFANYYKLPAAQGDTENCVAHNGSLVPVPGRDIKVQAWYQGGVSLMDFTDPANPMEIAAFDRGPVDANMLLLAGSWSAYWYNGNIYSSEIARGLDVFELTPTRYLSQNEIDAAKSVRESVLNVQSQKRTVAPKTLVVAKAYIDQLERSKAISAEEIAKLRGGIQAAEADKAKASALKSMAANVDTLAASAKNASDATRLRSIAEIFRN